MRSADFRWADLTGAKFDGARMGRSPLRNAAVGAAAFGLSALLTFQAVLYLGTIIHSARAPGNTRLMWLATALATLASMATLIRYGATRRALTLAGSIMAIMVGAASTVVIALTGEVAAVASAAVISVVAGAGAIGVAMAVPVAGKPGIAGLLASAALVVAAASVTSEAPAVLASLAMLALTSYLMWRMARHDARFAVLIDSRRVLEAIGGTRFDGAKLTGASFAGTQMSGVRLWGADLTRVRWEGAQGLAECLHDNVPLAQPAVRELVATRQGKGMSLVRADLHGLDLSGVDLRDANLREANCTGARLASADLTGACIEAWNIDPATDLAGIKCRYVYLLEEADEIGSRKRRPADPERVFEPGEFQRLYARVLEEMEILLKKGLSPAAMRDAFQELRSQHPDVRIKRFEDRDSHVLVGFELPRGSDEARIERTLRSSWDSGLLAAAESRLLSARDVKEIALAAAAAGVSVRIGGIQVEDKSINVGGSLKIENSQVGSLSGDVRGLTQTLHQAGGGSADLGAAIEKLAAAIAESKSLSGPEKHEAAQQVATVAEAAKAPKDAGWQAVAGKAIDRLTALLGKAPDLAKLVEVTHKAWEALAKSLGV